MLYAKQFLIALGGLAIVGGTILYAPSFFNTNEEVQNDVAANAVGSVFESAKSGNIVDAEDIGNTSPPQPGMVEYQNERFGFHFYHYPESRITEHDEMHGAYTIVLENEERVRGLQIFIVPYLEDTISEERFRADVPSGVRENIEPTTLGYRKHPAVTFTSVDEFLGPTREIWFIRGGYLFEITTFKGVGNWFEPIIQSWRFLD